MNGFQTCAALFALLIVGLVMLAMKPLYPADRQLSKLFARMAAAPDVVVQPEPRILNDGCVYWLIVTTSEGVLRFWNANRWYGWASEGSFISSQGLDGISWKGAMPGWLALRAMRRVVLKYEDTGRVKTVPGFKR